MPDDLNFESFYFVDPFLANLMQKTVKRSPLQYVIIGDKNNLKLISMLGKDQVKHSFFISKYL